MSADIDRAAQAARFRDLTQMRQDEQSNRDLAIAAIDDQSSDDVAAVDKPPVESTSVT